MKIAYNTIDGLVIQEMNEVPTYEHIVVTNQIQSEIDSKVKPALVDGQIVETATAEEIYNLKYNQIIKGLVECCIYLRDRAKISSVNKEPSPAYLEGQIPIYQEKYNCAKLFLQDGLTTNPWYQPIVYEMTNTNALLGTSFTVTEFMQLIVDLWESGENRNLQFQTAIEVFRCKTKDLATAGEFDRAKQCLDLGWAVPEVFSLEDLEALKAQLQLI